MIQCRRVEGGWIVQVEGWCCGQPLPQIALEVSDGSLEKVL